MQTKPSEAIVIKQKLSVSTGQSQECKEKCFPFVVTMQYLGHMDTTSSFFTPEHLYNHGFRGKTQPARSGHCFITSETNHFSSSFQHFPLFITMVPKDSWYSDDHQTVWNCIEMLKYMTGDDVKYITVQTRINKEKIMVLVKEDWLKTV